jgi:hypothetical protein
MRFFLLALLVFCLGADFVSAHVPNLVEQATPKDIVTIEDPTLSQAFYGEMRGFPHTYEIRATEPFYLFTKILIPDLEGSGNNVSGIIIKEPENGGRVTEITRLRAKEAAWESEYEPFGGDSYRNGPTFEKELEAGTYRIEVHTPDNVEKYVLVVGTREEMSIGYFETVRRIAEVKEFFGKSKLRAVESPFVYVPLLGLMTVSGIVWYVRRRRVDRV